MSNHIAIFISIYLLLQPLSGIAATVLEVQEMLHNLGYAIKKIDGRWGAKSRDALKKFQIDRGLPVTGKIDAATERALQSSVKSTPDDIVVIQPETNATQNVTPAIVNVVPALEVPVIVPPNAPTKPALSLSSTKSLAKEIATITTAKSASVRDQIIESPAGIKFVRVPGGCFTIGGGNFGTSEICVHDNSSFFIGQYEVTQGQWRAINNNNPSTHAVGADYPVENVSWEDVHKFIEKLNKQGQGRYRLPTEAEWEYSARANAKTMYWWGDTPPTCEVGHPNSANFNGDQKCPHSTVKVGMYQPNTFNLYDVHGNVWEWVEDVYLSDAYKRYSQHNPIITEGGTNRIFRGGSWLYPAAAMAVFNRDHAAPNFQFSHLGFRLIYEPANKQ